MLAYVGLVGHVYVIAYLGIGHNIVEREGIWIFKVDKYPKIVFVVERPTFLTLIN